MRKRLRCMKCLSHGFYVKKIEGPPEAWESVSYEYICIDCGETKDLEWEDI